MSVGRREEKREVKLDNYTPDPIPMVVDTPVELTADIHINVTAVATDYKLRRKPVTTVRLPGCGFPHGITYDYMDNAICIVDGLAWKLHAYFLETKQVQSINILTYFYLSKELSITASFEYRKEEMFSRPQRDVTSSITSPQPYAIQFYNNSFYVSAKCCNIVTQDVILSFSLLNNSQCKRLNQEIKIFGKHGSQEGEMNTPTGNILRTLSLRV